jgi:hypothetical protein
MDESPPLQKDRAPQPGRGSRREPDEPRSFEPEGSAESGDYDTGGAWTDDPDINTNGSER